METREEIILVVEDEDVARKNLEHILKKEGYGVISVNSGRKALDLMEKRAFDLVLTDLKMERVGGMEVLKMSRDLQPHTEVLMITIRDGARVLPAVLQAISATGADIRDTRLSEPNLESLFLKLTGKELRA